ncbi:MAG: hypothetical protein Q8859_14345 [Bacteroidota bacterium]|nr:hypothetical protein [Bacteroidota bacterium]
MEYITERKNPITGKAHNEIIDDPNKAKTRVIKAKTVKILNTRFESISFSKTNPRTHPIYISPQNQATDAAPSISGL